ncbi:MAG: hypothetical protein Q8L62_00690 [Candidatus Nitrotoga sp.]|nr:hypothetical protein [Candidatus Nitrotoga sp.]
MIIEDARPHLGTRKRHQSIGVALQDVNVRIPSVQVIDSISGFAVICASGTFLERPTLITAL